MTCWWCQSWRGVLAGTLPRVFLYDISISPHTPLVWNWKNCWLLIRFFSCCVEAKWSGVSHCKNPWLYNSTARTPGYTILPERFHLMLKVMHNLTERLLLKVLPLTKLFLFQFGNTWNIIILTVWPIQSFVFMTWKSHCFFICVGLLKVVRKKTVKPEVRQADWGTSEIAATYLVLQHEVHWGSGWQFPLKGIKKYSKHFVLERLLWFWLSQNCNWFFFVKWKPCENLELSSFASVPSKFLVDYFKITAGFWSL